MYVYYNPNPLGKSTGDCIIRGITKLTGLDWDSVYTGMAFMGLRMAEMPSTNSVWNEYLKRLGYRRRTLPDTCPDCYTVRDFCEDYQQGSYILATGSHVIAVKNGNYYDAWDSGNEIPVYYWEEVF